MISALSAVWNKRQVFRLRRHCFGFAFPCVPHSDILKPSSAITAAVPHGLCTRFPILPASQKPPVTFRPLYVRIPHLFPKCNGQIRVKYLSYRKCDKADPYRWYKNYSLICTSSVFPFVDFGGILKAILKEETI